jgi:hypothetical protein
MNKIMIIILVISLIGNCIGLLILYKYLNLKGYFSDAEAQLREANAAMKGMHKLIADMTARLDSQTAERMIFLHHSVGEGILTAGGLRDQLLDMGVLVKSATYGDDIGQETDMNNWTQKFGQHMSEILAFKAHPDLYNTDGTTNDYIMFKSCFPNSDITAEGTLPGDPNSPEKTITNYKAVFEQLKADMRKYPNKLFIYLTAPPLTPDLSPPDNAARARAFNNWLINEYLPQYQSETGLENFVIFDLFNCLAGADNYLKTEYRRGIKGDPHPNVRGSQEAAKQIAKFFTTVRGNWRNDNE